ncbi:MAG: cryptochrome/photolyase family protein [Myxococcales bacterium]|nr:cryptochrome/photolyase family protein [Polyangiaceae bacterium]MDW8249579.1 cryptochrome/photolyase family protein [Myxococcales bacterium]
MSHFFYYLRRLTTSSREARRWIFVPYDQLSDQIGPLARLPPQELGVVLVECPLKAQRRPYHQQQLALVLACMCHFTKQAGGPRRLRSLPGGVPRGRVR